VPTSLVASPQIVQGAIEESNVQPALEVTRMMTDLREFQFVTQFVQAEADRQQNAIDRLLPRQS
jgi:flagellar basal-body rod protein FlgF